MQFKFFGKMTAQELQEPPQKKKSAGTLRQTFIECSWLIFMMLT